MYYNKEVDDDYDYESKRPENADEIRREYGYDYGIDDNSSTKKIRQAMLDVLGDLSDDLSKLSRSTAATIGLLDDYYLEPVFDTDGDGEPDQCRADYASDEGNLARENFIAASNALTAAISYMDSIMDHLASLEELKVPNLGDEYYTTSDSLFASLRDMAGNMSTLNASLYQGSDVLTYDLVAVNAQFTKVLTMIADAITGSGIPDEEIPPVPEREGCTGHWPEYDYSALYFSDVIEAVYIPEQTTMAAETVREDSPMSILLVEGRFEDGACVRMTEYSDAGPEIAQAKVLEKWVMHIDTLDDTNCESYSVRYLPPKTGRRTGLDIYMLVDGEWNKVPTGISGSYLTFDCSGDTAVFCAVESEKRISPLLVGGGIVGAGVVGAAGIGFGINKKKRRKKQ